MDQARGPKVPDRTSPLASERLTWEFHFFKGQWSCKPICIYTPEAAAGSPRGAGQETRAASVLPSRPTGSSQKEKQKQRKLLCEARPVAGLPLLLDTTAQTSVSTNSPEKVLYEQHRPAALCLASPHSGQACWAEPGQTPRPLCCPSHRWWKKQLSSMLPSKSTDNAFLHSLSFPSPEAAAFLQMKLV